MKKSNSKEVLRGKSSGGEVENLLSQLDVLAKWLMQSGLEELAIELNGRPIRLKKPSVGVAFAPSLAAAPAAPTVAAAAAPESGQVFKSPLVGTFYAASGPDKPPFVQVGSVVKEGQTLGIIEAMKTMNQLNADRAGTIQKILVQNGQPVEFGQPLFVIG